MTRVAILPLPTEKGISYRAVSGDKQSDGKTIGEALDALNSQLSEDETGTMVIVQHFRPDAFFNAEQQARLRELMDRWRAARDLGMTLPAHEQSELDALIDTELDASAKRAASMSANGR